MSDTTESDIFKNMPDMQEDASDVTETENTTSTETADEGKPAVNKPADTGTEEAARVDTSSTRDTQTEVKQQPITRRDGLIEVPSKDNPSARDLVDPATGNIVAAGGRERATFERAQKLHHEARTAQSRAAQFEQQAREASAELKQYKEISDLARAEGVDTAGQRISVQLYSRFLKDPVGVLTDMVSEVKAKGYNIPFLEQGISSGMDARAMQLMLDQKLAPVTQQREQQEQYDLKAAEAKQQLDTFLDAEPDALHNIGIIGEMLTQEPALNNNLDRAWAKLVRMSYAAGLDPTQPLGPQYQAKQTQQTQQPARAGNPTQNTKPLPNVRPANGKAIEEVVKFDEHSRTEDIIRQAMRESGFTIS